MGKLRPRGAGGWAERSYLFISGGLSLSYPCLKKISYISHLSFSDNCLGSSKRLLGKQSPGLLSPARVHVLLPGRARSPGPRAGGGEHGLRGHKRERRTTPQGPLIFKRLFHPCWGMKTTVSTAFYSAPSEARLVLTSKPSAYLSFFPRH